MLIFSLALALFLGLEYSFPPLRFAKIGLGEMAAFVAYGLPLMMVGVILQTADTPVYAIIGNYRIYLSNDRT